MEVSGIFNVGKLYACCCQANDLISNIRNNGLTRSQSVPFHPLNLNI